MLRVLLPLALLPLCIDADAASDALEKLRKKEADELWLRNYFKDNFQRPFPAPVSSQRIGIMRPFPILSLITLRRGRPRDPH